MRKDIEWLKREIENSEIMDYMPGNHERWIYDLIDQLDEPETLSQEWIDNHTAGADTIAHYSEEDVPVVTVSDLEKLLVPKVGLPEIPDYVAEYIEGLRSVADIYIAMDMVKEDCNLRLVDWVYRNKDLSQEEAFDTFARAWLDGYTVEEKKYRVLNNCDIAILAKTNEGKVLTTEIEAYKKMEGLANVMGLTFKLTEQEIKDYDERYFAFAVPVKEMEK